MIETEPLGLPLHDNRSTDVATQGRALAVFDLDGTLVRGDTFVPFLVSYAWRRRKFFAMIMLPWHVLLYVVRFVSARTSKERLLRVFFGGESMDLIARHAEWFCNSWIKNRLRVNVVERLHAHQAAGDRVVLLSASPDIYVPMIGRFLGISESICTKVASANGVCVGLIIGANCKGLDKVEDLKRHLGCEQAPESSFAYGDSQSDLPILRWVRQGFMVIRGELVEQNCIQE